MKMRERNQRDDMAAAAEGSSSSDDLLRFERLSNDTAVDAFVRRAAHQRAPRPTAAVARSQLARELLTVALGGQRAFECFAGRPAEATAGRGADARGRVRAAFLVATLGGATVDSFLPPDAESLEALLDAAVLQRSLLPKVRTGVACVTGPQQAAVADALMDPGFGDGGTSWKGARLMPAAAADRAMEASARHHSLHPVVTDPSTTAASEAEEAEEAEEAKETTVVTLLPKAERARLGGARSLVVGALQSDRLVAALHGTVHHNPGLCKRVLRDGLGALGTTLEDQAEALLPSVVLAGAHTRPLRRAWTPRTIRELRARFDANPTERLAFSACFALLVEACRDPSLSPGAEPRARVVCACRALEAACLMGMEDTEGTERAKETCEALVTAAETPHLREEADALTAVVVSLAGHLSVFALGGGSQHSTYFPATALPTGMLRRPFVRIETAGTSALALVLRCTDGLGPGVATRAEGSAALSIRIPTHRLRPPQAFEGTVRSFLGSDGGVWAFRPQNNRWWRDGARSDADRAEAALATATLAVLDDANAGSAGSAGSAEQAAAKAGGTDEEEGAAEAATKDAQRALSDVLRAPRR